MGHDECRGSWTPARPGIRLSLADCSSEGDRTERQRRRVRAYEALVGCVQYAAISTRVDIAFAANQLARFAKAPGAAHWAAGVELLRYLHATAELGLTYDGTDAQSQGDGGELRLVAYTDADWAGDCDDRRSTTGFVVLLFGCAVSWASKKQSTVALSSTEAEYMGLSQGLAELKALHAWLDELGLRVPDAKATGVQQVSSTGAGEASAESQAPMPAPTRLLCDNRSALALCARSGGVHSRSKHIDVRHHFIVEAAKAGVVEPQWVPTADQLADILTKALNRHTFSRLREKVMGGGPAGPEAAQ